jgi:hypothetical protein
MCRPFSSRPRTCGAKRTRNSTWVPLRQTRSWMACLMMAVLAKSRAREACSGLLACCISHPRKQL